MRFQALGNIINSPDSPTPTTYDSSSSWLQLLGTLLLFLFIVVICFYTTKYVAGRQIKQMRNSNFRVIDTYRVTTNKYLQLINIGKQYVVIAVTKDNISVITTLNEEEITLPEDGKPATNFKDLLSELTRKKKTNGKG